MELHPLNIVRGRALAALPFYFLLNTRQFQSSFRISPYPTYIELIFVQTWVEELKLLVPTGK